MNAFALHDVSDQAVMRRWGASGIAIVAAHVAAIVLAMNWYTQRPVPGINLPAIMVDMAPVTSSPQPTPMDLAPGPVMQQADASPPEPAQAEIVEEQIAPTPPQEKPDVVAPPEQKTQPTPPKPEPAKIVPDQKPVPVKPKVVRAEAKRPTEAPPAPRTTAAPRAERQAPAASAVSAGARPRRSRPTSNSSPRICSASSNIRRAPRRPASRAWRGSVLRSAAAVR